MAHEDHDEAMDLELYQKWIGVRINPREHRGAHKNDDLCRKYATARQEKRRRRKRKTTFVDDVMEIPFEEIDATATSQQVHIEELRALPSASPPVQEVSLFWRLLGY